MKLYSKNNKEDLFDRFDIDIHFPIFKWGTKPGNEWVNDFPTKYIDIKFDTQLVYRKDVTWTYFDLLFLGFKCLLFLDSLSFNLINENLFAISGVSLRLVSKIDNLAR